MPLPKATAPQFRTLLLRRLKNVFPSCEANIRDVQGGLAFELFDSEGRARTASVNMYGGDPTKAFLKRAVRNAGEPESGFPPEMLEA